MSSSTHTDGRPTPRLKLTPRSFALVPLLVLLLVGSAGLRLASGAGQALAESSGTLKPVDPSANPQASADAPSMSCPNDPELNEILARLTEREAKMAERAGQIANREVALKAAEARLSQRISQLKAVEAQLTETMAKTATAAEDDVATLVAVYAAMKPKDAATLFEAMSPDFAAGFLRRMRPDAAAPIFAGLSPTHAYAVSAVLAGRNAEVPVPPVTPKPDEKADQG